jgi:hypothetical protein
MTHDLLTIKIEMQSRTLAVEFKGVNMRGAPEEGQVSKRGRGAGWFRFRGSGRGDNNHARAFESGGENGFRPAHLPATTLWPALRLCALSALLRLIAEDRITAIRRPRLKR